MRTLKFLVGFSCLALCQAIFFPMGGGGGGGGCGCSAPPACPQASPCPVCPPPQPCPPPPAAYCPQVQPVFIPSCGGGGGGGGCGGGGGGYASNGIGGGGYASNGGGGYATSGGGYASNGGGGYASNGGGGGGYASSGGGGIYSAPQAAPSGGGYAGPLPPPQAAPSGGGYAGPSGGGYSGGAAAAGAVRAQVEEAGDAGTEPPATQVFRSPKEPCQAPVKYIMLRAKKVQGDQTEVVEEELEQVQNAPHVEATASPLDAQLGEEIAAQEQSHTEEGDEDANVGDFKARGAKTAITDEKCNSKPLQKLVISNIVNNDALASKKAIHENALQQFPDSSVDVICSTTGFTYLVSTTEHCEAQKDGVICFVYKRPL